MIERTKRTQANRDEQLKMALSLARGNFPAIKNPEDRLSRIAACIERSLRVDAELLRAVQYADQMAEVLACMSGQTAEGRRAIKLGEELHERMRLARSKAEGRAS